MPRPKPVPEEIDKSSEEADDDTRTPGGTAATIIVHATAQAMLGECGWPSRGVALVMINMTMIVFIGRPTAICVYRAQGLLFQILKGMCPDRLLLAGGKFINDALKLTGFGTIPAMAADAALCGAVTYAVGYTTELYFKQNGEMSKAALKAAFKEQFREARQRMKERSAGHWQLSLRQSFNFENALAAKVYA